MHDSAGDTHKETILQLVSKIETLEQVSNLGQKTIRKLRVFRTLGGDGQKRQPSIERVCLICQNT